MFHYRQATGRAMIAIAAVLASSCRSSGQGHDLRYEGDVDQAMLRYFTEIPENSTIYLTSAGGEEAIALDIADVIVRKSINIRASRFCLSACAQYLLVASERTTIEDGTFVSFHMNSFAAATFGLTSAQNIQNNAQRAAALYKRRGISLDLLTMPLRGIGPLCVNERQPSGSSAVASWIPSTAQLQEWGVKWGGYWPENSAETEALARNIYKPNTAIRFGQNYFHGPINRIEACPD